MSESSKGRFIVTRESLANDQLQKWKDYNDGILRPAYDSGDEKEIKNAKTIGDAIKIMHQDQRSILAFVEGAVEQADTDQNTTFSWDA